jgi:hypothetical protein
MLVLATGLLIAATLVLTIKLPSETAPIDGVANEASAPAAVRRPRS